MKNLFLALVLFSLSSIALGQAGKKLPNRALNSDHSLCVDDGGVEKCLEVDGPTGNVIAPADFTATGTINGTLATDSVGTDQIVTNGVDTLELAADAVTGAKIGNDQINSEHYVADSIDTEHYAPGSVDTTAIGTGAVTNPDIGDDQVNSEHYAASSIDSEHIGDNQINSQHYADASIDALHISANAVQSSELDHNNAEESGSCSITVTSTSNVTGTPSITACTYHRMGPFIHIQLSVNVQWDGSGDMVVVFDDGSLPFTYDAASANGHGFRSANSANIGPCASSTSGNNVRCTITTSNSANVLYYYSFIYITTL